jgi:nitrilase
VAIGVDEVNATRSRTTLYNTLLVFNPAGDLVSRHRKLMPTGGERMIWTPSAEADLVVRDTPIGRIGGLICWENYMPLARYELYRQGMEILLAPTWDKSDQWIASMRHIAREGRTFVIGVCQALHRDQVPDRFGFKDALPPGLQWLNVGNSLIVDPDGVVLAGPVAEREEILFAQVDAGRAAGSRWIFDAAGHYDRPDLFRFEVVGPGSAPTAPSPLKPATTRRRRPAATAKRASRPPRRRPG